MQRGSGLRRGTPLESRTPLVKMSDRKLAALAAAGVRASSTFASVTSRTPVKPTTRRPVDTGPGAATVDLVVERDHFSCMLCGYGVGDHRGVDWSIHHRLRRSQGLDNSPSNLITVCGNGTQGHHAAIHARPKWARDFGGWLLKGSDDPAGFPVLVERGARWVRLTADGLYVASAPPAGLAA